MMTWHLGDARSQSRGRSLRVIVGIIVFSVAAVLAASPIRQMTASVPLAPAGLAPAAPAPHAAHAMFDATRAVILSPDLHRSAALVWLSEDRNTLSLTSQHLSSNSEPQGIWAMPPDGNWTRIGSVPNTEEVVAVFPLRDPMPQGSLIAIVLEGDGSGPNLIQLSGFLP